MKNINEQVCSGCGGCVEVCPVNCIHIAQTVDGFYKASADEKKCLNCGLCIKKCSMQLPVEVRRPIHAYAAYHIDEAFRKQSSSGGVFSALAKTVMDRGGVVFGAAFDENMRLYHACAVQEAQLVALRGSKYAQSDIRGVYPRIKQLLQSGTEVLFVGTPCQVAGLRTALGDNVQNLYTCDVVCHGTPSIELFRGYVQFLEKKFKGKILAYDFRSKEQANDRMSYTVKLTLQCGEKTCSRFLAGDEEPYAMRFLSGALQAQSCYNCPFAAQERSGDITLADYWGYETAHPELAAVRGVSLVTVNTAKGAQLLKETPNLMLIATDEELYLQRNKHLSVPTQKHPQRDAIYKAFAINGFTKVFYHKTFLPDGYKRYILKRRIKAMLK